MLGRAQQASKGLRLCKGFWSHQPCTSQSLTRQFHAPAPVGVGQQDTDLTSPDAQVFTDQAIPLAGQGQLEIMVVVMFYRVDLKTLG